MKKFLPFLSIALIVVFVFASCSNKPDADAQAAAALQQQQQTYSPDTVGLSQFQAWKAQNELADVQEFNKPEQYAAAATPVNKPIYKAPVRKATRPVATAPKTTPSTSSCV